MAGFGEQLQAAAPMFLGIGSQLSGRDPMGIARGMALMQAKSESDKRKAAINNMLSGMGIAGPQKAFLESMPPEAQQQWILQQMAPQEPVRGVQMGDRLVNPITGEVIADYSTPAQPFPWPDDGNGTGGAGYTVDGGVRMEGVSDPALRAWNTFANQWTGPALTVTSAYRDPDHNRRVGGAEKSQHLGGNAFDFSTAGWSLEEKKAALQLARDIGFTGAGIYGNAIHLDVGPPRVWGPSYSNDDAPDWAEDIMLGGGSAPSTPQQASARATPNYASQISALESVIAQFDMALAGGYGTKAEQEAALRRRNDAAKLLEDTRKRQQEAAEAAAGPGFDTDLANTYRDDMRTEPALTLFADVQSGFDAIEQFYQAPGAVSDYALAVAFAKIVDPGSVAREGEVAAVSSAAGAYPAFEQALKNAITREGKMPPEMRKEIADLGAKLYAKKADRASTVLDSYQRRAERAKIPFDEIWSNGPIRTLPDDWVSTVDVLPNAVDRFAPPAVVAEQPQPAQPPAPAMNVPSKEDVQAVIDSLTPAQRKTFGRLRTPSAKLDYLVKLGKL